MLEDLAKAEIETLEADGISVTPEEAVCINDLCRAILTPLAQTELAKGIPYCVGGETLWPLTMYAVNWLEGVKALRLSGLFEAAVIGYAMRYSRGDGGELDVADFASVRKAVAWYWRLKATRAEYEAAIDAVCKQDVLPPVESSDRPMSIGEFSAYLSATVGGSPEMWEKQVSIKYARNVATIADMQARAAKGMKQNDPTLRAEMALGNYILSIRKSRQTI